MKPVRFIQTTAAMLCQRAIDEATADEFPTLIISDPGMGKTTALKHFVARDGAVYWEVRESQGSIKQLFHCLMEAFRFAYNEKFTSDVARALYDRLTALLGEYPYLAVDEFQNLDLDALRELLRLAERCRLPLVLAGNDRKLNRTKSRDVALDQIRSRLGARVVLGPPLPEDCRSIALDHNVEGKDAYQAVVNYGAKTSLRDVVKLLRAAGRATGGMGTVQLRHLQQALLINNNGDQRALALFEREAA